jgi:hypothetical protein
MFYALPNQWLFEKCGADKLANDGHKYFRFPLVGLPACFLAGGLLT